MRIKSIILAAALAAFFSPTGQAIEPYAQMIPMRVLCVDGGPEPLLIQLLENYNEVPRYSMEIKVQTPYPVGLIITENQNNGDKGSSTILMVNANLNVSCVFFTSLDTLKDNEAESLPAKVPAQGETDA
jgi:hypothetical protein